MSYTDYDHIVTAQPDVLPLDRNLIERSAVDAEAIVNSYLAGVYTLPFASPPPLLVMVATDIAVYRIFTNRSFTNPPQPIDSAWGEKYRSAIDILTRLANGEITLTDATGVPIASVQDSSGAVFSNTMNYVPTMGEGADQGFFVDRNKVENEAARRNT